MTRLGLVLAITLLTGCAAPVGLYGRPAPTPETIRCGHNWRCES